MADLKTKVNNASVAKFLGEVSDDQKRKDCRVILKLMKRITGEQPRMWGPSIVGFGKYRYAYASGRQGDWPLTGFSPRKQNLTMYIMSGFARYPGLMKKLGKYKTGSCCLYVKKLDDINLDVLEELIARSVDHMNTRTAG